MSEERKLIDWTKPIECVNGVSEVKWLHSLKGPGISNRHVLLFTSITGYEAIYHLDDYGCWSGHTPCVRNVPERRVDFVININGFNHCSWATREIADEQAHPARKAIVTIYECDGRYTAEVEHV